MNFFRKTLSVFFGLALIGALGVGGYFALKFIAGLVARLDSQVAAVTACASVVALVAAMIIASRIRRASSQNNANHLRAEKSATYQFFINLWEDLLRHGRESEDRSPNKFSEELQSLDRLLILYGSPGVVKAHTVLRALERESGAQHPNVRSQFARALMEIRKDLGSQTQGLTAEALQQLVFANTDKAAARIKANAYHDLQPRVSLTSNS